jgi:hypothetical protein
LPEEKHTSLFCRCISDKEKHFAAPMSAAHQDQKCKASVGTSNFD